MACVEPRRLETNKRPTFCVRRAPTKVPTKVGQTYKPTMSPTTHHTCEHCLTRPKPLSPHTCVILPLRTRQGLDRVRERPSHARPADAPTVDEKLSVFERFVLIVLIVAGAVLLVRPPSA